MRWTVAGALFVFALAVRLPFRVEHLWAHDSVLYERAVMDFDPTAQRPHPPGYVWYVLLVRAVAALTGDPNAAMTLISAIAGAAAVALLYLLASRMYDERTGRVAAVFLMTAVTFWGESAVAYPYTLLAALTTGVALLLWRAIGSGSALLLASLGWGVAVGFRTDLALALAPVWLVAAWSVPTRDRVLGLAGAAAAVFAWVAVSSAMTPGGAGAFLGALAQQGAEIEQRHSVFANGPAALGTNAIELARYLGRGLYFLAPLVAAIAISREIQRVELRDARRTAFTLLWTLTPVAVFLLVHVGEYGHTFSALPGLSVLAARGAIGLVRSARVPRALPWAVGATVLANAAIFLFSDSPLSAYDLARRDTGTAEKVLVINGIDADRSLIVTGYDQLVIERYLPGRRYLAYEPNVTPQFAKLIPCVACQDPVTVVVWDDLLRTENGWRAYRTRYGSRLRMIEAPPGSYLRVRNGHTVAIQP